MKLGSLARPAFALALAALLGGCEDAVVGPPAVVSDPPVTATPAPTPAPTATPAPVITTRRESVTFASGSIDAQSSLFDVGVRGSVEVAVGCHMSFVPIQLVKAEVLAGGTQRVAAQHCGPAFPTCADIGMTLDLERGGYVVLLSRDARYRFWTGYMCDVSVTGP